MFIFFSNINKMSVLHVRRICALQYNIILLTNICFKISSVDINCKFEVVKLFSQCLNY